MVQTAGNAENVLKTKKTMLPVCYYLSGGLDVDFVHIVKSENQKLVLVDSVFGVHMLSGLVTESLIIPQDKPFPACGIHSEA